MRCHVYVRNLGHRIRPKDSIEHGPFQRLTEQFYQGTERSEGVQWRKYYELGPFVT